MNNTKNAESLVGIIIGVFILSFILIGMINVIGFSKEISFNYENQIEENLIKTNSENIISKLDTSILNTEEKFYIQKDTSTKEFKIMTGTINKDIYGYVDRLGNNTSSGAEGKIFERNYQTKIDILRHVIYPPEIDNLVFHFDASNTGSLTYDSVTKKISSWNDLSGNNLNATQSNNSKKPILIENIIGEYSGVKFEGNISSPSNSTLLEMNNNIILNNDEDNYANRTYEQKSYAIVFKTGDDISNDQVIYEEGGSATGYNFMIHDGKLYAGIHNIVKNCTGSSPCFKKNSTQYNYSAVKYSSSDINTWYYEWDTKEYIYNGNPEDYRVRSIKLDNVLPNTVYFISIVQDSSHFTNPDAGDGIKTSLRGPIDSQNKLQIFLNGNLVEETNGVDPMPEHHLPGIGNINEWSVTPRAPFSPTSKDENLPFNGVIGEFISWNHALTVEEVRGVQNYFVDKWLGGTESVRHNIIETDVSILK